MRKFRGFAAIVAVFILVVLGGLGAVLVTVFSGQQRSAAFDALGTQAYQAARTGVELGAYQAITGGGCGSVPASFTVGTFTVSLECSASSHTEGGEERNVFQITATACNRAACPANADGVTYVERQIRTTLIDKAPTA